MSFKDTTREGMKYGLIGGAGAAAGAVGAAIAASAVAAGTSQNFNSLSQYDGLLINANEYGLGIIPLVSKGVQMFLNPAKLEAKPEGFVFFNYQNIEEIKVKNFNIFNKKVQTLKIKVFGAKMLHLTVRIKEKLIPYQEQNFTVFMNRYKKK